MIFNDIPVKYIKTIAKTTLSGIEHAITRVGLISFKTRFELLEKENDKLHMTILMNQGVYIDTIVESVMENMIVGAILAVLILILFLKDIKPTLVFFSAPDAIIGTNVSATIRLADNV